MKKVLSILFVLASCSLAQITVNSNTYSALFTNTNSNEYSVNDDITASINLGTPSSSAQTFDFSNLFDILPFDTSVVEYTVPGTHPGSDRYTNSDYVYIQDFGQPGFTIKLYLYYTIESDGLKIQGMANNTIIPGLVDTVTYNDFSPYFLSYPAPFTYGNQVSAIDTSFTAGTNDYEASDRKWVCDGFGTLILPGGNSVEALRYTKTELEKTYEDGQLEKVETRVDVEFLTNSGYLVSFSVDSTYTGGSTVPTGVRIYESGATTSIGENEFAAPQYFGLAQNYPNPFNPETKITFSLLEAGSVNLSVYTMLGEFVAEISNSTYKSGVHEVSFNAGALSSGVYIYRMSATGLSGKTYSSSRKMLLMK